MCEEHSLERKDPTLLVEAGCDRNQRARLAVGRGLQIKTTSYCQIKCHIFKELLRF